MRRLTLWAASFYFATMMGAQAAILGASPWSVTLYFGPSSPKFFSWVIRSGRLQATGAMVGLAVDRRLAYLGWGVSLAGEAQITQYGFGHSDTSFALGLGIEAKDPFGISGTRLSAFTGPSYSVDPPLFVIWDTTFVPAYRKKLLNYVGIEYAVQLPGSEHWSGVFRFYHRSGAFGIYNSQTDDGIALGLGVRYGF